MTCPPPRWSWGSECAGALGPPGPQEGALRCASLPGGGCRVLWPFRNVFARTVHSSPGVFTRDLLPTSPPEAEGSVWTAFPGGPVREGRVQDRGARGRNTQTPLCRSAPRVGHKRAPGPPSWPEPGSTAAAPAARPGTLPSSPRTPRRGNVWRRALGREQLLCQRRSVFGLRSAHSILLPHWQGLEGPGRRGASQGHSTGRA